MAEDKVAKGIENVAALFKAGADTYVAGRRAQSTLEMLKLVLGRMVAPDLYGPVVDMARRFSAHLLEAQIHDPSAAVKPARQILNALADVQRVGDSIRAWARTPVRPSTMQWFRRDRFWDEQAAANAEQLSRLRTLLDEVTIQCDMACRMSRQEHNLLQDLVPTSSTVPTPSFSKLPNLQVAELHYRSTKQQVQDVRRRVGALAEYLSHFASRSIAFLEAASLHPGIAYSPSAVRTEGALLIERAVVAQAACDAIEHLANQPVSDINKGEVSAALQMAEEPEASDRDTVRALPTRVG
jgi:hypothetical protein